MIAARVQAESGGGGAWRILSAGVVMMGSWQATVALAGVGSAGGVGVRCGCDGEAETERRGGRRASAVVGPGGCHRRKKFTDSAREGIEMFAVSFSLNNYGGGRGRAAEWSASRAPHLIV